MIELHIEEIHPDDVFYSLNGGGYKELKPPYLINTTLWYDGPWEVHVKATDTWDNENSSYFMFTIDSLAPDLVLQSPLNNSYLSSDLYINFTIMDMHLNYTTCSINKESPDTFSDPYTIDLSDMIDSVYNITIYTDDLAGNYIEEWFIFIKDTLLPEIVLNTPENGSLMLEPTIIDFNATDVNLDTVSYSINQGPFTNLEEPYDLDPVSWEDGEYLLTIQAVDRAGNTNERWFSFRLDTTPPTIATTTPPNEDSDFSVDEKIIIEFSESMDTDSVESAISITPYMDFSFDWSNDNRTLMLNLSQSLEYDTTYQVSLNDNAQDLAGRRLANEYEFGFTTQKEPEDGIFGFLTFNLIMILLIAIIIIAVVIAVMLMASKRKRPNSIVQPPSGTTPSSQNIQVRCSGCNNNLLVNDIGTKMNVTCPFCSTLLTVQSQRPVVHIQQTQPQSQFQPQPQQPSIQISCPSCRYAFSVARTSGPMHVQCPNCGAAGTISM